MRPLLSKQVRALLDDLGDRKCIPAFCAVFDTNRVIVAPSEVISMTTEPVERVGIARLTDGSIARIVKPRCVAAGLEPHEFAGHSLRAGMVTSAENGVAELAHPAYIDAQSREAPAFAD